jgi:hypothetical protein
VLKQALRKRLRKSTVLRLRFNEEKSSGLSIA